MAFSLYILGARRVQVVFPAPVDESLLDEPGDWELVCPATSGVTDGVTGVELTGDGVTFYLDILPLRPKSAYVLSATGLGVPDDTEVFLTGVFEDGPLTGLPSESFVDLPPATDVPRTLIYPFLQAALRQIDSAQGGELLKRLLRGPERVWAELVQKIAALPSLSDPLHAPPHTLEHMKGLVGFGSGQAGEVAKELSRDDLRRLILVAVPFWQRRGTLGALRAMIRMFGGTSPAIDDWFWDRWIIDEVLLGGDPGTGGPWLDYSLAEDVPSGVVSGEMSVSIRVPDSLGLNRTLVEGLCQLARPAGERYGLAFVDFLDTFLDGRAPQLWVVDGGTPSWEVGDSSTSPPLLPGVEFDAAGGTIRAETPRSSAWTRYVWTSLLYWFGDREVLLKFYQSGADDYYWLRMTPPGTMELGKRVGGVDATIETVSVSLASPAPRAIILDVDHAGTGPNQIRVYLDATLVLDNATDSEFRTGTVSVEVAAGSERVRFSRTELWQRPLDYRELTP